MNVDVDERPTTAGAKALPVGIMAAAAIRSKRYFIIMVDKLKYSRGRQRALLLFRSGFEKCFPSENQDLLHCNRGVKRTNHVIPPLEFDLG